MSNTREDLYQIYQSPDNRNLITFSMCGITYPDKNYTIIRKKSNVACIEYVEEGSGIITADNMKYRVNAGDAYFLQRGQNQYYYADSETPWKKYFINIEGGRLLDSLVEGYRLRDHIYYENLNIKNELMEIIELAKERPADKTAEIICIVNRIFHKMSVLLNEIKDTESIPEKMREFLDIKAPETFSLEELCEYVSLSESQAIRLFKKTYNITPYAYFMNEKIELAKNMLLNTSLSIKDIAHELHYADEYYFSNVFKKKMGVSPKAYKLLYLEKSEKYIKK